MKKGGIKSSSSVTTRMLNRLEPFTPPVLPVDARSDVGPHLLGTDLLEEEYGFKDKSMQDNFFTRPPKGAFVLLMHTGAPPETMADETVVARLFGTRNASEAVVWHVSVRKSHPLNDGSRGKRWGVYGIEYDGKKHWFAADKKLTRTSAEKFVRGSPNPYATRLLVEAAGTRKTIRQHEAMPCAQLFHPRYSHRLHPQTLLLYLALGFRKAPGMDAYVWSDPLPPLHLAWERTLHRMSLGVPAVFGEESEVRGFARM